MESYHEKSERTTEPPAVSPGHEHPDAEALAVDTDRLRRPLPTAQERFRFFRATYEWFRNSARDMVLSHGFGDWFFARFIIGLLHPAKSMAVTEALGPSLAPQCRRHASEAVFDFLTSEQGRAMVRDLVREELSREGDE
jgi:hypothetical protein